MQRKYHSNLAFNDLLFNVLFGFVILFIIAFLMINPITKKNDIPARAEFMITMEWPVTLDVDIDIWVKGPGDELVGFKKKEGTLLNLGRDDLGHSNDTTEVAGKTIINPINRELVTIRGVVPGEYLISIHYYSSRVNQEDGTPMPVPVTVTVLDVNPYREVYAINKTLHLIGQEMSLPAFEIDDKGTVVNVYETSTSIVPLKVRGPQQ